MKLLKTKLAHVSLFDFNCLKNCHTNLKSFMFLTPNYSVAKKQHMKLFDIKMFFGKCMMHYNFRKSESCLAYDLHEKKL